MDAPHGWTLHFDGAFSRQGAGAGVVLTSPLGKKLFYAVQLCFKHGGEVSNNIAEYEGLLAGLRAAIELGIRRIKIDPLKKNYCGMLLHNYPDRPLPPSS